MAWLNTVKFIQTYSNVFKCVATVSWLHACNQVQLSNKSIKSLEEIDWSIRQQWTLIFLGWKYIYTIFKRICTCHRRQQQMLKLTVKDNCLQSNIFKTNTQHTQLLSQINYWVLRRAKKIFSQRLATLDWPIKLAPIDRLELQMNSKIIFISDSFLNGNFWIIPNLFKNMQFKYLNKVYSVPEI